MSDKKYNQLPGAVYYRAQVADAEPSMKVESTVTGRVDLFIGSLAIDLNVESAELIGSQLLAAARIANARLGALKLREDIAAVKA